MENLSESGILTNFLGAITDSLVKEGYSSDDTRHLIVASLLEIIEKTVREPDGRCNFYVMKPIYRFLVNVYREENRLMQEEAYLPQIQKRMRENEAIIQYFSSQIQSIENNMPNPGGK